MSSGYERYINTVIIIYTDRVIKQLIQKRSQWNVLKMAVSSGIRLKGFIKHQNIV